jgi:hypothetical protein
MGQATRTTRLSLDLGKREEGGANPGKRAYLDATGAILNQARAFYLDFFLAHAVKLAERVSYYSEKHLEMRTRAISPNELLTWAEGGTVATREHPHPWEEWNVSERFPGMPLKTPLARPVPISPIAQTGKRAERSEGNRECLGLPITPPSTRGQSSWI